MTKLRLSIPSQLYNTSSQAGWFWGINELWGIKKTRIMKRKEILLLLIILLILSSCLRRRHFPVTYTAKSDFYQLLEFSSKDLSLEDNSFYQENDDVVIFYNFWDTDNRLSFSIHNKSNEFIYLDLEETYFVLNSVAYDYYTQGSFSIGNQSNSSNTFVNVNSEFLQSSSSSSSNTNFQSQSINSRKLFGIPPGSNRTFSKFQINDGIYNICDLNKTPMLNDTSNFILFSDELSPISFQNFIAYYKNDDLQRISAAFYVKQITYYNSSDFINKRTEFDCDLYTEKKQTIFYSKYQSPNRSYFKYSGIEKESTK
jgi:hypothetical protein